MKILFGVVRNKISSKNDWQFNGHNEKDKQTNNDLQSTKAKFKTSRNTLTQDSMKNI